MTLTAFILAAGFGERLLPITQHIPKPLLPILGKPVLEYVLDRITDVPIKNIGVNLHHKKNHIEQWIMGSTYSRSIKMFPEDPILGTGGALKNAQGFLKNGPFLVHNADIISDMGLEELIEFHFSAGNLATLAVHNHPEFNRLVLDENAYLKEIVKHPHPYPPPSRGRESSGIPPSYSNSLSLKIPPSLGGRGLGVQGYKILAFTGIAVYQPEFLQFLPPGNSSVVDAWIKAVSAGYRIGTMDVTGCYWTDIGTPSSFTRAVVYELNRIGENVHIHQSVKGCEHAELDGYIVLEKGTVIDKGVTLRNCISLTGATIGKSPTNENQPLNLTTFVSGTRENAPENTIFENCILGRDFALQLSESDFQQADTDGNFLIGSGGSDRKYYRAIRNQRSAVLMRCPENEPHFARHIQYTTFFRKHGVPVPELIHVDTDSRTVIFEDFGDLSLYGWLKCKRTAKQLEDMYKRVLDTLIIIHTNATERVNECPQLNENVFDYEHLRWETNYFVERFLKGVKNIEIRDYSSLENEFHRLAILTDSFTKTIVHRDFQSQNIMITKGNIPRVLDYQGARMGPPAYDVVSLLWDPYYRLENNLREVLLDYYTRKVSSFSSFWKNFRNTLLPCRLQRHMQALGAYGFLSRVKGRQYFEKHIPEGIRLLKEDIIESGDAYPTLRAIVIEL